MKFNSQKTGQVNNSMPYKGCGPVTTMVTNGEEAALNTKEVNGFSVCAVTVICTTYNHSGYIRQCLDSLINQETTFEYQIIVHDDASTDGTTEIVLEFAERFPELVKPVIQGVNLYSQGESHKPYIKPLLRGKYIALCEGDDWWIDQNKLQKQFDYMNSHPECSLCTHNTLYYDDVLRKYVRLTPGKYTNQNLTIDELISGGGGLLSTNSLFFRVEHYNLPEEFCGWGVGDYPRQIYLATQGTVHCLSEAMSVYRIHAKGSWTLNVNSCSATIQNSSKLRIAGLRQADAFTKGRFSSCIDSAIFDIKRNELEVMRDWDGLHAGEIGLLFSALSITEKGKSWIKCFCPKRVIVVLQRINLMVSGFRLYATKQVRYCK